MIRGRGRCIFISCTRRIMEKLLNALIEKGWIPFGIYGNWDLEWERICIEEQDEYTNEYRLKVYWINVDYVEFNWLYDEDKHFSDRFSLREIVSKWSWLWQFVCENGMINIPWYKNIIRQWVDAKRHKYYGKDYRYWLCESSLKDESELEDFLLQNINVEWKV